MREKINSIDYVRGVASVAVLLLHIQGSFKYSEKFEVFFRIFASTLLGSGVDAFFIVSGFVIFRCVLIKRERLGEFLIKRFFRVCPLYWISTLFLLVFFYHDALPRLIKCLFFIPTDPNGYAPMYGTAINYVGWTLAYEMYFYILSAIAIAFSKKRDLIFWMLIPAIFILGRFYFGNEVTFRVGYDAGGSGLISKISLNSIVLEFYFGMIISYLYHNGFRFKVSKLIVLLAVTLVIILLFLTKDLFFSGISKNSLVIGILYSFVIYLILMSDRGDNYNNKLMLYLSRLSFSLYVTHPITLDILKKLIPAINENDLHILLIASIFMLIISLLVASVVTKFIEEPINNFGRLLAEKVKS